jgi:uncharacterized protein (TIGR00255 family)
MRSMTGHGRGTAERAGRRATVEIRAVNHRHLDLKLRGASLDPVVEEKLTARLRKDVERGSVTVTVHLERRGDAAAPKLDRAAARAAHDTLSALAKELGLPPPELALVVAQPGVITGGDDDADAQATGEAVLDAATAALDQLASMRAAEGKALAADLLARLDALGRAFDAVEVVAAGQPEDARRRLNERLSRLLDDGKVAVDPQRLAQEVALLADRLDVTEELVRARSHLAQARTLLAGQAAAGRRLDFLVQELGREINTIGSKSGAAEISRLVVEAKAELEKIREQAQNLE